MPQDRESGAAASAWGRATARKIALALGATVLMASSNECLLNGERVVIKCAAPDTDQVGVTYKMLPRLRYVLGAFQREGEGANLFDVYALEPTIYLANERATRSKGRSAGRVGKVRRGVFESQGQFLKTVTIQEEHDEKG